MGEIAHVDLERLRRVADSFSGAADEVAGLRWPDLDPGALPGSAVAEVVAARDLISGPLDDLVAGLQRWATAARAAAEEFQRTDSVNGTRFTPR